MDRQRTWTLGAAAVAALLALSGCGGGDDDASPVTAEEASPTSEEATSGRDVDEPAVIDACTLLTAAEAGDALGGTIVGSGPTSGVGESVCAWEIDGDWSITVSVGSPGTAPGDTFDPALVNGLGTAEPVVSPDGAHYVGLGTVAFAVDERVNTVTVVTEAAGGADRDGAVELAPIVAQRIADATS